MSQILIGIPHTRLNCNAQIDLYYYSTTKMILKPEKECKRLNAMFYLCIIIALSSNFSPTVGFNEQKRQRCNNVLKTHSI